MFKRALRLCSTEWLNKEIEYLIDVFRKHNFSENFIFENLSKAKWSFNNSKIRKEINKKRTLILNTEFSRKEIKNFGDKNNINIVFKPKLTIGKIIHKHKRRELEKKDVIYGIGCKDCEELYIGETGQNLKDRIYQHKYAVMNNKKDSKGHFVSALSDHKEKSGHEEFKWDEVKIFGKEENRSKRKFKESFFIRKEKASINRREEIGQWSDIYNFLFDIRR
jgi:hypothetical protein